MGTGVNHNQLFFYKRLVLIVSDTASIGYPSAARVPAAAIELPAGQKFSGSRFR